MPDHFRLRQLHYSKLLLFVLLLGYHSALDVATSDLDPHALTRDTITLEKLNATDQGASVQRHVRSHLVETNDSYSKLHEERLPVTIEVIVAFIKAVVEKIKKFLSRSISSRSVMEHASLNDDYILATYLQQEENLKATSKDTQTSNELSPHVGVVRTNSDAMSSNHVELSEEAKLAKINSDHEKLNEEDMDYTVDEIKPLPSVDSLQSLRKDGFSFPEILDSLVFLKWIHTSRGHRKTMGKIADNLYKAWGGNGFLAAAKLVHECTTDRDTKEIIYELMSAYLEYTTANSGNPSDQFLRRYVNDLLAEYDVGITSLSEKEPVDLKVVYAKYVDWRRKIYEKRASRVT